MILAWILITRTRGSVSSKDKVPSSYYCCFLDAIRLNNNNNNNDNNNNDNNNNNETRFLQ